MKIAIVGAGFCGLAVAWHLLNHSPLFSPLQIHLFDCREIGKGVSGIAAGLLHPYSGAHAKLNWKGQEGFQATNKLLRTASHALGRSVMAEKRGILRLALNDAQMADFQRCAQLYPEDVQWLDAQACQLLAPGSAYVPGLWIKEGMTVFSSLYLQGLKIACEKLGLNFENKHIHSLAELDKFDITIAATGAESLLLPELNHLPIKLVKGQVLELSWPKNYPPLSYALNSQVYILMTEKGTSCLVGATYEKGHESAEIDVNTAQKEIMPKAYHLFPPLKESSLINCFAGMRTVTPQHHPLLQRLSKNQWVLTGMGSKGLLYHAFFAEQLVNEISKEV